MAGAEPPVPEPGPEAGIADIQSDIERTREELGDTVAHPNTFLHPAFQILGRL